MARVQSSTPGGGVEWQFRCCDGGCGRTYRRPAPLCTHVNHGMESDDPEVAAMHLAYAATFDPSVYLRCAPIDDCPRSGHHLFYAGVRALQRQHAPAAASAAHDAALSATARWSCAALARRWTLPTSAWCLTSLRRSPPSMPSIRLLLPPRLWVNRCLAGRCHSRTAAFLASGSVFALHKDDPAAREEREKSGGPLRVRPLGIGSVLVRPASAHALGQVGADAREVMGPVQRSFQSGAGCETAYMSMRVAQQLFGGRGTGGKGLLLLDIRNAFNEPHPEWMTGALGRRREAHATLLERIASFGTLGYGCHHGAMRLLVVSAVRQTGFLSRMMPPSELDPFLEAVDAANISAAFSLLGLDACDQSTPRMRLQSFR
eukprot:jgi/Tetstr1/430624/TSEL_020417.t1